MKIGLIHLSDIHFRRGFFNPDADNQMARDICAAVRTDLIGTSHVILVVSGDIAFAGAEEEYSYATDWFSELYTHVADGCDATCWIIVAPGNHDLYHDPIRPLRSALIEQLNSNPALCLNPEIVAECLKEQIPFRNFRDNLESDQILVYDHPLLRVHRLPAGDSTVQLNILNSAWMSSRDEKPGSIIFPIDSYSEQLKTPDGFSITVLHHPLGWFQPEYSRKLRTELGQTSSIVLYGHEHLPDSTRTLTSRGDHVRFIDGGVLSSRPTEDSSFNLILLDTDECRIKDCSFQRRDDHYEPTSVLNWQNARRLTSAESDRFRLNDQQRSKFEDSGINIIHPRRDHLCLSDLFVYPDLLPLNGNITTTKERPNRAISAETLIFEPDCSHVILEGEESVGKTALLRMLFGEFCHRGKVPLYLYGANVMSRSDQQIRSALKRVFEDTYEGEDFIQYEQLQPSDRIVLLDDFEFDLERPNAQEGVLDFFRQYSDKTVVVTKDIVPLQQLAATEQRSTIFQEYKTYHIQEFGHLKRDELIKRWLLLGRETRSWNITATLKERDQARAIINTTIGRNLMPSSPVFVLIILQSIESTSASSIGSTYGHYYQFLIISSLIHSGVRSEDLDAFSTYISELAYNEFFVKQGQETSQQHYLRWHQQFCSDYGIEWEMTEIVRRLERGHILAVEDTGAISFKYQYIYYFFLAKRLSRGLSEESIRNHVRHMCDRLHVTEYANVVLFLIHHSDDEFVLDAIRKSAASLMQGQPAFTFDVSDDNRMLNLINRLPKPPGVQLLEDREPEREQERALGNRDLVEAEQREIERRFPEETELKDEPMDALDTLAQAGVAAKTVELLGQVLKNYYGSLRINTKITIGKDAVELSLKALYSFLDLFISNDFAIVDLLVEARRDYEREKLKPARRKDERELERWARDCVFGITRVLSRVIIRKVAKALGSDQLRPTLAKLVSENPSLGYGMIEIAALLDNPGRIPRDQIESIVRRLNNNPLGFQILRDLTAQRIYRYPTDYDDKQWLAEKLSFSMVGQRYADLDKSSRILSC